jgi:dCMP deaminase
MNISWDNYFLNLCNAVSMNSKCLSRKVGAIIVDGNSIISTGYNGAPRGIPSCNERYKIDTELIAALGDRCIYFHPDADGGCPRQALGFKSGEGLEWCVATHGEVNAIINAARHGICVNGTTMYMNCNTPCKNCLAAIINSGITEIVVTSLNKYDKLSEYILGVQTKLKIREYDLK